MIGELLFLCGGAAEDGPAISDDVPSSHPIKAATGEQPMPSITINGRIGLVAASDDGRRTGRVGLGIKADSSMRVHAVTGSLP
jgi:hypothetical protein